MTISNAAMMFGMQSLVVKEWHVNPDADTKVLIKARKGGLVDWLLNLLGLDSTTVFRLDGNHVSLSEGSLAGHVKEIVPLTGTCNLGTAYLKPFGYIIAAIVCFLMAFMGMCDDRANGFWIMSQLFAGIVSIILYFLNRCMVLYVIPDSGSSIMIAFKRSVIEGVDVDEKAAMKVVNLMSDSVIGATRRIKSDSERTV